MKKTSYSLSVKVTTSIKEPDLDMPKVSEINNKFESIIKKTNIDTKNVELLRILSPGNYMINYARGKVESVS